MERLSRMYQEQAISQLVPGLRESSHIHRSAAFRRWEDRASVRRKPQRHLLDVDEGLYFSPELHPVSQHPLVSARGPKASTFLLVRRLYDYLNFTTELESLAVIPVATSISRGRSGLPLSGAMRGDAFKIVTDEAWHAQFSYDLAVEVSEATGIPIPSRERAPAFLCRLDEVRQQVPSRLVGIEALLFCIVSETLISGVLSEIPRDERLPKAVRDLVRDHAEDEGRHHAYFRVVLRALWEVLSPTEKHSLSLLIPQIIYAFLEPDYGQTSEALAAVGMSASEIEQCIGEAWTPASIAASVASGARPIIRYLAELGALEGREVQECFTESGLWLPESSVSVP